MPWQYSREDLLQPHPNGEVWPQCGHPLTPENTQRVGIGQGLRCRLCRRETSNRSRIKMRLQRKMK